MEALWWSHWWPVECSGSCLSWQEGWVGGYRPLHQQPQLRGRAQISRSHYLLDFSWKWQNMRFEMQAYKIHQIVSIKFKVFNVYLLRNTLITFVRTHASLFSCKQIKNNIIALHPTALIFMSWSLFLFLYDFNNHPRVLRFSFRSCLLGNRLLLRLLFCRGCLWNTIFGSRLRLHGNWHFLLWFSNNSLFLFLGASFLLTRLFLLFFFPCRWFLYLFNLLH